MVLLVVGLAGAGVACDDGEDAQPAPTTVPAPEGALRLGVPEEPGSLNPFDRRSRAPAAAAILAEVLPQLFRVDPGGRVGGYLADEDSVRQEEDAAGASFRLREGARWSDGTPITAADLRFTAETFRSAAWPGTPAGYDRVVAVEGEGAEVRLRFDGPFPGWRRLFSGPDFVLPAHRLAGADLGAVWPEGPDIAGGPFRLAGRTPGLEVVLAANDGWWGEGPRVEQLRVTVVPDVRTMEQLLDRGDLDVAWPPAVSNRRGRFSALDGVDVSVSEPGGRLVALVANTEAVPAARRRAVLALPDRDRFVDVLLAGEARLATTLAGVAGGEGATWAEAGGAADPPGLDRGETDTLVASEAEPMAPVLGRLLQTGARASNYTLELKFAEAPLVDGDWLAEGSFDFALVDEVAWPDPCWRCWFAEAGRARGNVARVGGLDDLAGAAERGDPGAGLELERRLGADGVLLPLWRPAAVLAGRGVDGLEANAWSIGPFWGAERWSPPG